MKIKKLSASDIDCISAGEVVLNLCSVIKELIENAIDSGANSIFVNVYSKFAVIVTDNGCGMGYDDLKLCALNHTTSKFTNINNINTLGFRGEALYSISKVSRLMITTKTENSRCAYCLSNNEIIETAGNVGTTVHVKDLFYNIPVRQKFIHSESKSICNLIQKYTLCYANISFTLKLYDKIITYSINNVFDYEKIYHFGDSNCEYKVHGYVMKSNKEKHFMFVNKRVISNAKIHSAIMSGLNKIGMQKNVSYVIFIEVPSYFVDINIHPAKTDIRFMNDSIFDFIYSAIVSHMCISNKSCSMNQNKFNLLQYVGLIYNRYILATNGENLIIIDAHAAHERIITESLKSQKFHIQSLMMPIEIELNEHQYKCILSKKIECMFSFSIRSNMLIIDGVIDCLYYMEHELIDMIYRVLNSDYDTMENILYDFLHEYGCKNSLRHNNMLLPHDCKSILELLFNCDNHEICNHGRKTFIDLSLHDLNKKFER